MSRLERKDAFGNHYYLLDGVKADGVTTAINNGMAKPALVYWAAQAAANYTVDNWSELAGMTTTQKIKAIQDAPNAARNKAAARGTDIHGYGEKLITGEPVDIPEEHLGPATAYAKFLDQWQIHPIAIETPLANTQHGYAGTADLWASIGIRDNTKALIDLKTGKDIYPSFALQLAAYRYADLWQPDGPDSENTAVPQVTAVYAAHILTDDVRMVPVTAGPKEFRAFLYVLQTARWVSRHDTKKKRESGEWTVDEPLIGEGERP